MYGNSGKVEPCNDVGLVEVAGRLIFSSSPLFLHSIRGNDGLEGVRRNGELLIELRRDCA